MSMFSQAKDMYKLQKQAKQIKQKLKNIHIEGEADGVKVVVTAEQEVVSIDIPEAMMTPENKSRVEKAVIEAMKKCMKKAQEIAALEMKEIMGGMGLPGMGG